jgi:hypothetical protein
MALFSKQLQKHGLTAKCLVNAVTGEVKSPKIQLSGKATNRDLWPRPPLDDLKRRLAESACKQENSKHDEKKGRDSLNQR